MDSFFFLDFSLWEESKVDEVWPIDRANNQLNESWKQNNQDCLMKKILLYYVFMGAIAISIWNCENPSPAFEFTDEEVLMFGSREIAPHQRTHYLLIR